MPCFDSYLTLPDLIPSSIQTLQDDLRWKRYLGWAHLILHTGSFRQPAIATKQKQSTICHHNCILQVSPSQHDIDLILQRLLASPNSISLCSWTCPTKNQLVEVSNITISSRSASTILSCSEKRTIWWVSVHGRNEPAPAPATGI